MTQPATVRDWTDLVRRARLGRTNKAVALMLATYADSDGSRVYPGVARLSFDCELGYNVVQQALGKLRTWGLITLVRQGVVRGAADEYRLTIPDRAETVLAVPDPATARKEVDALRDRKRGQRVPKVAVDESAGAVDNVDVHPTATGARSGDKTDRAPNGVVPKRDRAPHGDVSVHPTAWGATYQDLDTTTTDQENHPALDLRTTVTVSRARSPDPPAQIFDLDAYRRRRRDVA